MRVLFLNPEDTPWSGNWKNRSWDLVVDLGWAGSACYRRWGERLKTRIVSLYDFQQPVEIFRRINQLIEAGRNQLMDSRGLDWWEIQAVVSYETFQTVILLSRLKNEVAPDAEIHVSRLSSLTSFLNRVWDKEIYYFERSQREKSLSSLAKRVRKLSPSQILEIAFDKWDADHQLRRHWHKRRANSTEPVVLLPSTYVNVARTVLGYANLLPNRKFLLAYTRKSGSWSSPPANVLVAPLSAYALPAEQCRAEAEALIQKWQQLKRDVLLSVDELKLACDAGLFDHIPSMLSTGLSVRNAWQCLFEREPVQTVLCADDMDAYARISLILARHRGLRTIYCAHGALDSTLIFRQSYADFHLAKGEMERDHLVATCGIPDESVVVGAGTSAEPPSRHVRHPTTKGSIIFFSQPYEVYKGRADEACREILPRLCAIAREHGCKVVAKLHPFESRRERRRLIKGTVPASDWSLIEISKHRFASELLDDAWFGISVNSSVALECTLKRIPFFNCGWLEPQDTGYLAQFSKFGVGRILHRPEEISRIPELLGQVDLSDEVLQRIFAPTEPENLDRILFAQSPSTPVWEQRSLAPRIMGRVLRRVVYPMLGNSGYLRRWRDRQPERLAVVTYHGVLPDSYRVEDPFLDDGLLRTATFRQHIRFFKSNYCVITPEDFHAWLQGGDLPTLAVLLTCDDGLLNNATEMLPVLVEEGLRCLFFVTGYSLREKSVIAWYLQLYLMLMSAPRPEVARVDSLETKLSLGSREESRSTWWRLVKELSKHDADRRAALLEEIRRALGLAADWDSIYREHDLLRQRYLPLSLAGLHQLVESGMTLGGHTLRHPLLTQCSDEVCWKEIASVRDQLQQASGKPVWPFAYPFGDLGSVSTRELVMAEEAGYECAFLNAGGCVPNLSVEQRFALPRLHVSANMGIAEVEALVSGFDRSLRNFFQEGHP